MQKMLNLSDQQHKKLMRDMQEFISHEIDHLILKALVTGKTPEEVGLEPMIYSEGPTLWDKYTDR